VPNGNLGTAQRGHGSYIGFRSNAADQPANILYSARDKTLMKQRDNAVQSEQ